MTYDCIIIGAGAAGLFCSASFKKPVRGLLLEKTKRPGTKLLMSGGGQCNITHDGSIKDFIKCYGKNGGKIRNCLYRYSNEQLLHFLHEGGVRTITREDGKIFPASMDAHEIRDLLLTKSRENGFTIQYESPVCRLQKKDDGLWQVFTSEKSYLCENLVIASGGCSYPSTGSDGSLFPVLKRDLNIEIEELRPALTPVNVFNYPYKELSGLAFEGVHLTIWRGYQKITEGTGDFLFTHENFSGPLFLNFSKDITINDKIVLNYLYPCDKTIAMERISNAVQHSKMNLPNTLSKGMHLPRSFSQIVINETGNKLKAIASKLTADTFIVKSVEGFQKAMVTSGGISLNEINLKTMELKKYPHLYAIGELLDIDGWTGGYNLQFAYSSARAASSNIITT